jgi:hypothetical protein
LSAATAGLAFESFGKLLVGNFNGNSAIEPCIASFVDLAHAARANQRDDLVRPESSSSGQRHSLSNDFTLALGAGQTE